MYFDFSRLFWQLVAMRKHSLFRTFAETRFVRSVTPGGKAERSGVKAGFRLAVVNNSNKFETEKHSIARLLATDSLGVCLEFGDPRNSYYHFFSQLATNRCMLPRPGYTPRSARCRAIGLKANNKS